MTDRRSRPRGVSHRAPASAGPASAEQAPNADAPIEASLRDALDVVGDRWALLIVHALAAGPARYADLVAAVEGIAPNILASRLRRLEAAGVVLGRPYSVRPMRLVYELTEAGSGLVDVAHRLAQWSASRTGRPAPLWHRNCGTPLAPAWWCPTCELRVDDPGEGDLELV